MDGARFNKNILERGREASALAKKNGSVDLSRLTTMFKAYADAARYLYF